MTSILNPQDLLAQLQWRYAVKQFDPTRKIDSALWQTIEQSLILTPSSYGLQPWKFVVVTDQALKEKLRPASWNQSQITDCSHLVVILNKIKVDEAHVERFITRAAQVRGVDTSKLEGYKNYIYADVIKGPRAAIAREWAMRQCYIALGNLMTSVALLGLDACPLEGIEPPKYNDILELQDSGYETCVACAVGYRSPNDAYATQKKVRFVPEELVIKR